jgi:tetratricopeptide (TPR) repeat protein
MLVYVVNGLVQIGQTDQVSGSLWKQSRHGMSIVSIAWFLLVLQSRGLAQSLWVSPIPLTVSSCEEGRNLTDSGIRLSGAKHFSSAYAEFESALKLCPEDENVALDLLQTSVDMRDFSKTESIATGLLVHHPNSEPAHVLLAYSYLMRGQNRNAGKTLQEILAGDRKNPDALKLMGLTLFFFNEYDLAETELRAALAVRPDENALYALGRVYQTQKHFPSAIQSFRQLISRDPAYYRAYDNLALCYEGQGNISEADAMFKIAEQVASKVSPSYDWPYANHAEMLLNYFRTDEALQYAEQAVRINPRSAHSQFILGYVLLAKDDLAGAERHLVTSIQLDANSAQSHYVLGRAYRKANETDKAQQEFARFKQLSEKADGSGAMPLE